MDQNTKIKKSFPPAFKLKVALEALKGVETPGQLGSRFSVHPIQVGVWKKQAIAGMEREFTSDRKGKEQSKDQEELIRELYQKIGKLEIEKDFLKRKVELVEQHE